MSDFRYILVRHIPDLDRMEPENVGLVLQGDGRIHVMFDPHAARRDVVDTDEFRAVKDVLIREINGPSSLFQPLKNSEDFLDSLKQFESDHVRISKAMHYFPEAGRSFDDLLHDLAAKLVLKPGGTSDAPETRATGFFRRSEEAQKFVQRGLLKHSPVVTDGDPLWTAYRQYNNGVDIVVDKVESAKDWGKTSDQIDKIALVAERVATFLRRKPKREAYYYLLADRLAEPFANQPQENFDRMRRTLDQKAKQIRDVGGSVFSTPEEARALVGELDRRLPSAA